MIKSDQRERNYIRQEFLRVGGHRRFGNVEYDPKECRVTPKQKRRIRHKKNHQAAQWRRNVMGGVPKRNPKIRNDVDYGVIARGLASVGRRWGKSRKDARLDALLEEAAKPPVIAVDPGEPVGWAPPVPGPKPMCPTCSAVLDDRCVTREGKPTRRHKNRP